MPGKYTRLFHTIRHLRLRQVLYQLYYRATNKLTENKGALPRVQGDSGKQNGDGKSFTFLNQTVTFRDVPSIDWNYAELGKLWTYNLNYFEFLREQSAANGQALIDGWIEKETAHLDGWEPYPISLRLVSWVEFYQRIDLPMPSLVKDSFVRQYHALQGKIEYHLGGNHLLENAFALYLSAHFLSDTPGIKRYGKLLSTELDEQYLEDGAHYELAPMYHLILLDRALSVYGSLSRLMEAGNIAESALELAGEASTNLAESIKKQLGWARSFCTEDGRYAHFNDSTNGIAPNLASIVERAKAIDLVPARTELGASGYRRVSTDRFDLWIDAAAIGPGYIPGHAHADSLTFTLHHLGQPIIVDPSISTYEKTPRRAWERSTESHNTITINDKNSSDVWGGFRVGKRAITVLEVDKPQNIVASHNGYDHSHRRSFQVSDRKIEIKDEVGPMKPAVARFHFAHELMPELTDAGCTIAGLSISWSAGDAVMAVYEQAIGYNQLRPAKCLEVAFQNEITFTIIE